MADERGSLYEALDLITTNSSSPALNWTVDYAYHAKRMIISNASDEDLTTQILYVLNNITRWRCPEAKNVRATLKAFVKAH